jgi:hypothetical protein
MAITRNTSAESQKFWKKIESNVRQMESWPEWKQNIEISASGSGFTDGPAKSKTDSTGEKPDAI